MPPPGGCDFADDPERPAPANVCWLSEAAPAVTCRIICAPLPQQPGAKSIADICSCAVSARVHRDTGIIHVILGAVQAEIPSNASGPAAVLIPLDDDLPTRVNTALRLWATLNGKGAHLAPTQQQQRRVSNCLWAADARRDGATYRDIASALFSKARIAAEHWKTSSLRAQVIRLVGYGNILIAGGYTALLRLLSPRRK